MPLAYDAARRRRRTGPPPPRTSVEAVNDLFEACHSAILSDVQNLVTELGTLSNLNKQANPHKMHHGDFRRKTTLLIVAIRALASRSKRKDDQLAIVQLLLDAGADPNECVCNHTFPFDEPLEFKQFAETALNVAVYREDPQLVQALLRAGANPNLVAHNDKATPPLLALRRDIYSKPVRVKKQAQIIEMLLASGADVNLRDGDGATLLLRLFKPRSHSEAESTPPTAIVRAVLQAGANPNLGDLTGALPLHYAVALGDPQLVQLLLQAGANPNAAPPAQTPTEREAHLCNYFHPSYVRKHKRKALRVEHGVRFPYALPDHAIAKVEHRQLRCFRETPWQLATLISYHHKFELDVLGERAFPICHSALRNESLLRQNRAWRKLRAFCRLRYQLFNLYELVCTPDRIDVAADLAAATDGLYAP